ncbi:MAG: hypothetical protein D6681_16655 [Calditrichaeota bacterium]|nr:MAG: hypothetical protein D6681_16655 [Calditrichota bacterium]
MLLAVPARGNNFLHASTQSTDDKVDKNIPQNREFPKFVKLGGNAVKVQGLYSGKIGVQLPTPYSGKYSPEHHHF